MTKNVNFMENLRIQATNETPEVLLTVDDVSTISGRSLPENAFDFYEPLLNWIKAMVRTDIKQFTLVLSFDYFNSSSGRYIHEILHQLDRSYNKNGFSVIWKYESEDDLMIERGEAFQSLCSIPFDFVEVKK